MSKGKSWLERAPLARFAAIDFETADQKPDSACAVAVVRVEQLQVVRRRVWLLRPPRRQFLFTALHGISWEKVAGAPTFADVWPELAGEFSGLDFVAAHYAPFDRRVLETCCLAAAVSVPSMPFICTVILARRVWDIRPTKLPDVCSALGIALQHHNPASDAEACAEVVIRAAKGVSRVLAR